MKLDRICKYCNHLFNQIDGKVFANHVRWCPANTTNGDKGIKSIRESCQQRFSITPIKQIECEVCGKPVDRSKNKEKRFCSKACANSIRIRSVESKLKTSIALKNSLKCKGIIPVNERPMKICPICKKEFQSKSNTCSVSCGAKFRYKNILEFRRYKFDCQFKFALKDFPDKFDFDLIKKFGWYKAKNRGNNLNGVSRDHAVSIIYGWKNKIPPEIISHPANCILMRHNENISKSYRCSMTIEELKERISNW